MPIGKEGRSELVAWCGVLKRHAQAPALVGSWCGGWRTGSLYPFLAIMETAEVR